MADVAKTPVKRKSFGGKQESAKKPKVNAGKTPKGTPAKSENGTPKVKNVSPKIQKNTPKGQNGVNTPKTDKKQKNKVQESEDKTVKPFAGTAGIESPKKQQNLKKGKKSKAGEGKPKRSLYFQYKQLLSSDDSAARKKLISTITNKIKTIEDRPDPLTKTAKRKLGILKRIKKSAEEGSTVLLPNTDKTAKPTQVKTENAVAAGKKGKQQMPQLEKSKQNQKQAVKKLKIEIEEDDDSDEESDEDVEAESGDESDDEGEEEEDDGDEEEDDEEDEDDNEDSDEESDDETPPPKQEKNKPMKKKKGEVEKPTPNFNASDIEQFTKNELIGNQQKRYVLFVGNVPYDTKKEDLKQHFQKCGEIKHIRIPTEKKTNKPRGFVYIELENAETYQKCLSMHHTFLKGRRINVLYTQSGGKKGEDKKKEIKAKNFKLHALRKQGKLAGSKKESQKRSFRRKKQKEAVSKPKSE